MDDVKSLLVGLFRGACDSILGIAVLKDLDTQKKQQETAPDASPGASWPERPTTLARRRAAVLAAVDSANPQEPRVLQRIFQCCALNGGVFGLSIVAFHYLLLPCVFALVSLLFGGHQAARTVWGWLNPVLSYTFQTLWVLPLFVLSKVVNSLWFQDIANLAYRQIRGRPPQLLPNISRVLADTLFSVLVQTLFLFQSLLVGVLPIGCMSDVISLLHLSLLYSLYAFEYTWFNMGWELHRRLSFIEQNWPYFVGFGLPLALLTSWPSSFFISGCIFSILFPLFIISGHEAVPLPDTTRFPLQLFSPSIWLSNAVFKHLSSGSKAHTQDADAARRTPSKTHRPRQKHLSYSRLQAKQNLMAS